MDKNRRMILETRQKCLRRRISNNLKEIQILSYPERKWR